VRQRPQVLNRPFSHHLRLTETVAEKTVALERRNRELAALNAIATAISQSLDLSQVLETAVEQALPLFDVEAMVVLLVDENAGSLRLRATTRARWQKRSRRI